MPFCFASAKSVFRISPSRPIENRRQIILSELDSVLRNPSQLSLQKEYFSVRKQFFPSPFEDPAHYPDFGSFYLTTEVSRTVKKDSTSPTRLPVLEQGSMSRVWISPRLNVPKYETH